MVATTTVDLIVALVWVGGVTLFLLGRAVASWLRFRRTSNFALYARLLSEATEPPTAADPDPDAHLQAEVVPFPRPSLPGERSASKA